MLCPVLCELGHAMSCLVLTWGMLLPGDSDEDNSGMARRLTWFVVPEGGVHHGHGSRAGGARAPVGCVGLLPGQRYYLPNCSLYLRGAVPDTGVGRGSSTDTAYGATTGGVPLTGRAARRRFRAPPRGAGSCLRVCYAMSGIDSAYAG
eukprot:1952477-Rhodomonas_salina.4